MFLSATMAIAGVGMALLAFADTGVVARVNGVPITSDAVVDMMDRLKAGHGRRAAGPEDAEGLRKEALDRLIFEELAYQKARADGIVAEPGEVDGRWERMNARMGGAEELNKALERDGRTEGEVRAGIERDIVLKRIYGREVAGRIVVAEDDVTKEYEREKHKFVRAERVVVDDIVFFLDTGEKASIERVEGIRRRVLEDKDRNPWALVPDGTFVVQEVVVDREKQKVLYAEAVKLKPGELSGVIETADSLHLIRLKEYSPGGQLPLNQVRGGIDRKLRAEASRERLRQWDAELRKGAEIEIMDGNGKKP